MSLKTDFFDGATGLQTKMNDAFDAGVTYVDDNIDTLSDGLIENAAKGNTTFTVNVTGTGSVSASNLRANSGANLLYKAFMAGIQAGLAEQDIYSYECAPTLNIEDSVDTSVDFDFTFATT
jgi:acetylornithine deacetylase/succinyl-diaminopimelate desuccinylase-like protein